MHISPLMWIITIAVVLGVFIFDFYSHVRKPHQPSTKECVGWLGLYAGLTVLFALYLYTRQADYGIELFTGYITELSLSVDNLFVFSLIIGGAAIPLAYQQKVLLIGIGLSLVFRMALIAIGATAIAAWSWVFYIFGFFLFYTVIKVVLEAIKETKAEKSGEEVEENSADSMLMVRIIRRFIPVTKDFKGDKLFHREKGVLMVTPLMLALLSIGLVDWMFALDSIPAIFGITTEPYVVFCANACALMGLRYLYFLLNGLMERIIYLPYALGVILGFIAVKLVLEALNNNSLAFINGGHGLHVPEISTGLSLGFMVLVLLIAVIASQFAKKSVSARAATAGAAGAAAGAASTTSTATMNSSKELSPTNSLV
ncbi:MAG: TerC/Alx family metal homeostasis membrane protein [Corynebacterium sp.]|nr:TerC/Alx family metal homeostasis membrane protein [Corynebacterium sp.]